jgi:hypothetical protein
MIPPSSPDNGGELRRCRVKRSLASSFGLLIVFLIFSSVPIWAHHGGSEYDTKNLKTLKGTVTDYYWANPHCQIFLDVKDPSSGKVTNWGIETLAPAVLKRAGWNPHLLKAGDVVSVTVAPSKHGTPIGMIRKLTLPDGTVLTGGELGEQPPQR